MSIPGNTMCLDEVQDWCEQGKPLNDAAFGLLFEGIQLSLRSRGEDKAISHYFAVAGLLFLAKITKG